MKPENNSTVVPRSMATEEQRDAKRRKWCGEGEEINRTQQRA
jgi:hypothetical protein